MSVRKRAFAIAAYLLLVGTADAQTDPVPALASVTDANVTAWIEQNLETDGWIVFGADGQAVALGNTVGVERLADGMLRAEVRHEYYEPQNFTGFMSRSNVQLRTYDCARRRQRVDAMSIFEFSNMRGRSQARAFRDAAWTSPEPDSLKERTMIRVCLAPIQGERLR